MQFVQQLIQKYDPATVFVSAATVVVCVELAVMRVFVPASASAMSEASLVAQICTTENIEQSAQDVQDWSVSANSATKKFLQDPAGWQEELVEIHTIDNARDTLVLYINNPFLSAILFTTEFDLVYKLNKKKTVSITDQPPTFGNASPILLEYLDLLLLQLLLLPMQDLQME